jgi:hypothetical protein
VKITERIKRFLPHVIDEGHVLLPETKRKANRALWAGLAGFALLILGATLVLTSHIKALFPVGAFVASLLAILVAWSGGGPLLYLVTKYVDAILDVEVSPRSDLSPRPPRYARFLMLLMMPNAKGDALLGDLEERFHRMARDPDYGPGHARFCYWFQVIISVCPLAWAFIRRVSGLAALVETIKRIVK